MTEYLMIMRGIAFLEKRDWCTEDHEKKDKGEATHDIECSDEE